MKSQYSDAVLQYTFACKLQRDSDFGLWLNQWKLEKVWAESCKYALLCALINKEQNVY